MTKSYEMNTIFETAINRQIEVQTAAYSFGEEAVSKCEVSYRDITSRFSMYAWHVIHIFEITWNFRWLDRSSHQQRVTSLKWIRLCVDMAQVSSNGYLIWDQNERKWTKFLSISQFYMWVRLVWIFKKRFVMMMLFRHFEMQIQMKSCSYWHSFSPFLMVRMIRDRHITYIRKFSS